MDMQDVLAILPTVFGKGAIYQILVGVKKKMSKECACVLVICPLRCPLLILRFHSFKAKQHISFFDCQFRR